MNFFVYVLSDNSGRLYKGMTNNLERRLKEHTRGKTKTTRNMENVKVVYKEIYKNRQDARKRELYLKSAAGRRFLKKVLN